MYRLLTELHILNGKKLNRVLRECLIISRVQSLPKIWESSTDQRSFTILNHWQRNSLKKLSFRQIITSEAFMMKFQVWLKILLCLFQAVLRCSSWLELRSVKVGLWLFFSTRMRFLFPIECCRMMRGLSRVLISSGWRIPLLTLWSNSSWRNCLLFWWWLSIMITLLSRSTKMRLSRVKRVWIYKWHTIPESSIMTTLKNIWMFLSNNLRNNKKLRWRMSGK